MLTLFDRVKQNGRVTRRHFLTAGAFAAGAGFGSGTKLSLANLLAAETGAGPGAKGRSIVNIHLDGGPPQMDMIDLKPDAPREIRGEFRPIDTSLDGFQMGDRLPKLASIAHRFAFLRSIVGAESQHDAFQCLSGYSRKDLASMGGRPAMGSVLSKLWGDEALHAPTFVDLLQGRALVRNSGRPGFLGVANGPFRPDLSKLFSRPLEPGMEKELERLGSNHTTPLTLDADLGVARASSRLGLLSRLDRLRREVDDSGQMEAMDHFSQQAMSILLSGKMAAALDLENLPERDLKRYTLTAKPEGKQGTSDGPEAVRKLLVARRLIEAGARCVTVSFSDFDTHSKNYPRMKRVLPIVDHAIWAFVTDLEERGMLDDVTIMIWGEFGRTPKVNKNGGRDHWPAVSMGMMTGGGLQVGQVLGATDRYAAEVTERPIHFQDVFATLYHTLGIAATQTTIQDPSGRPQYLIDRGRLIDELV